MAGGAGWEFLIMKQLLASGPQTKEEEKMADEKKMTVEEVNEYMKKQCGFVPRMFQIINTVTPEPGKTFADFYASIFGDGALSRKVKELMFIRRRWLLFAPLHHPCHSGDQRRRHDRRDIRSSFCRHDTGRLCPRRPRHTVCL
jgi:hypothetical protein